jgi:hypothetical protein
LKEFQKIRRGGGGYIVDYLNDAGGESSTYAMAVASALIAPVGFIPGYSLTIGIQFEQSETGLFKLIFMSEKESQSQSELIMDLIDSGVKNHIEYVYADRTDKKDGFFANVHQSGIKTHAPWRLMPAPSAHDVLYGISLVTQYINDAAINCPADSVFFRQLDNLGIRDQRNTQEIKQVLEGPELYVFHALRFILAGIERDILPVCKPGNVYKLEANKFYKPSIYSKDITPSRESGFFV